MKENDCRKCANFQEYPDHMECVRWMEYASEPDNGFWWHRELKRTIGICDAYEEVKDDCR